MGRHSRADGSETLECDFGGDGTCISVQIDFEGDGDGGSDGTIESRVFFFEGKTFHEYAGRRLALTSETSAEARLPILYTVRPDRAPSRPGPHLALAFPVF